MKAQLWSMRQGYQSENLARFILAQFSFVAQPTSVADDIGSDFYCTLFETRQEGQHKYLLPRSSFVIQIKSDLKRIKFSNKIDFLDGLQIPFFVGVVDKGELRLTVYSGEYIPMFFAHAGPPNVEALELELCDSVDPKSSYIRNGTTYRLRLPKVIEIAAILQEDERDDVVKTLLERGTLIQENIASRRVGAHLYHVVGYKYPYWAISGRGSKQVFRRNFLDRLVEVFLNLRWIRQNVPSEYKAEEFEIYREFYNRVAEFYDQTLPPYVRGFIGPVLQDLSRR